MANIYTMRLVFATNNKHKLEEVRSILPSSFEILDLKDIGCFDDLPETGNTIEANAMQKARYVFDKFGMDCFADDTGLEIDALDGRPGVYSARYAGLQCNFEDNVRKVLAEMNREENRLAKFRTVIALIRKEGGSGHATLPTPFSKLFKGEIKGKIALTPAGTNGFGYDPIFIPEGYSKTYAEMDSALKNSISHRAEAVKKLVEFLRRL